VFVQLVSFLTARLGVEPFVDVIGCPKDFVMRRLIGKRIPRQHQGLLCLLLKRNHNLQKLACGVVCLLRHFTCVDVLGVVCKGLEARNFHETRNGRRWSKRFLWKWSRTTTSSPKPNPDSRKVEAIVVVVWVHARVSKVQPCCLSRNVPRKVSRKSTRKSCPIDEFIHYILPLKGRIMNQILLVRLLNLCLLFGFFTLPCESPFPRVTMHHTQHLVGFVFKFTPSSSIHKVAHSFHTRSKPLQVPLLASRVRSAVYRIVRHVSGASVKRCFDSETLRHCHCSLVL
jgi:hypothetical protein